MQGPRTVPYATHRHNVQACSQSYSNCMRPYSNQLIFQLLMLLNLCRLTRQFTMQSPEFTTRAQYYTTTTLLSESSTSSSSASPPPHNKLRLIDVDCNLLHPDLLSLYSPPTPNSQPCHGQIFL